MSGCGSDIGEFFNNSCTITDTNDCVIKRTGGEMFNYYQHDDGAAATGVISSIGKPSEEGQQQQHHDMLQSNKYDKSTSSMR